MGLSPFFEGFTTKKSIANAQFVDTPIETTESEVESKAQKVDHTAADVSLIDDSYWRSITVNSDNTALAGVYSLTITAT